MKKRALILGAGLALLLLSIGAAQGAPTAVATRHDDDDNGKAAAAEIRSTDLARLQAIVRADTSAARRYYASDYQLINPLGMPQTLEDFLGSVGDGSIDFLVQEPVSPMDIRVFGKQAVVRYRSHVELVAFGLHLDHQAWHTLLYERRRGHWLLVLEQTTAVPNNVGLVLEALKPV